MSVSVLVQQMIDTLEAVKADAQKHDNGQNAAGTRVRKAALDIKNAAAALRKKVSEDRDARK